MPNKEGDIRSQHRPPFINCTVSHTTKSSQKNSSEEKAPIPKIMCDISKKSKGPSLKEVKTFPPGEEASDTKHDKTKLQETFGIEAVN